MENHPGQAPIRAPSQEPTGPAGENTPPQPRRRRRVPIACASCRLRKTKCDHIVPRNAPDKSPGGLSAGAHDYIRSLEYRLRQYETKLREHQSDESHRSEADSSRSLPPFQNQAASPSLHAPPSRENTSIITAAGPPLFLGGKSGVSFTQLILNAMNPTGSERVEAQAQLFSTPRDPSREIPDITLYALPPDARDLIQLYFDFHHAMTPIFHIPTISAKFDQVFSSNPSRRHEHSLTLAIINMICAIAASHRRHEGETPIALTRKFYDRAMALLGPTLLFDWSIEKVQILLLGARYLQISNYSDECWTVLGLAIRIAHGLELHRPPPESLDCISKEVRKRLWYACYTTDQLLSTIYGRPAATPSNTFSTPLPEDLDDDCIQPSRLLYPSVVSPSIIAFFIHNAKLYRIMETAAALDDPPLEKIVQLDEAYEGWYAQLPSAFKIHEQVTIQDDKSLIMAMRANMVRILIHRHSLVTSLNLLSQGERVVRPTEGLRANMMQNSRHICVRTAEETIQLVSHRYDRTKRAVGPSWFNLYYLFNAILIIASHVVDPEFRDDREALSHLEQGMYMIRQMSANHTSAQRAHVFLRQLLDLVEKTLPVHIRKIAGPGESESHPGSSVSAADSLPPDLGYDGPASREFMQFWDNTEDLTMALGSQLESYSTLGNGMWSWGYGATSDARMYAVPPQATGIVP